MHQQRFTVDPRRGGGFRFRARYNGRIFALVFLSGRFATECRPLIAGRPNCELIQLGESHGVVRCALPSTSVTLTAADLELGAGVARALGDGTGKWRLLVASDQPIVVMSPLLSPTGHLTNLSALPREPDEDGGYVVPLFPAASDPLGRQGFVRVVNRSDESGTVSIEAFDDSDFAYPTVTLALNANQTQHFNSDDLELGNADKGLTGSTGSGMGDWRLVLSSGLDIDVLAYIRTQDGFLTSMHDVAPMLLGERRVAIFNSNGNPGQ